MNERLKRVHEESEEIMERTGRYIPPGKLADMMTCAGKIMKTLTTNPFTTSYEDCCFILDVVRQSISLSTGEES